MRMHAATADYGFGHARGHRHHHHHHRGPGGPLEDFIAAMTGRGGPFSDPRMFKAFFGGGPGFGPPAGPRGHRGGRGRARRGDVRAAMLLLLEGGAQNGYQLIQEIERPTDGVWKPSPGSVCPAPQQLEDEELVRAVEFEGKRAYELSDTGRPYVDEHREELGAPFAAATGGVDEG